MPPPLPPGTETEVPLAPMTTLGIGGPARYLFRASSVDDIASMTAWASTWSVPLFILAGGSNLLVSDDGFAGLVLKIDLKGVTIESEDEFAMVQAAAGEPWDPFVERMVMDGFAGIECLSGIPGLVGATPIQNVGAYGQEVSETVARVEAFDRSRGIARWFSSDDCRFRYRDSLFKSIEPDRYVILSVTYRLRRNGKASVRYPELRRYLEERGESEADLRQVRAAVLSIRRRKGMVLDPADPDTRSDGSFFTNPIVTPEIAERLRQADNEMPAFPAADGMVKLSAAWLIERAGFQKGHQRGSVGLSTKHTLAIVNRGGGTAAEVVALVREIQQGVAQRFAVRIVPEPRVVGFPEDFTSTAWS